MDYSTAANRPTGDVYHVRPMPRQAAIDANLQPTPLWAISAVTFLASMGTGVVWNGISFIAKHDYHFTERKTLALYLVLGVTYIAGAFSTSHVLRRLEHLLSPRAVLGLILGSEAVVCSAPYFVHADWMLWVVACLMSMLGSWQWPIVESYLTAGRHGPRMRRAIGWWNLSWTTAVALAVFLMAPLMTAEPPVISFLGKNVVLHPRLAIVVLGMLHAIALIPLRLFKQSPGRHDQDMSVAAAQREYPLLLQAARVLLPLSYVLNSAMSPLLPFLFQKLELRPQWETPVTSTWLWVRIIAMTVMWQLGFWHGRWGTLLLGGIAMTLGFGLVVTGISIPLMVIGLSIFGVGMGIVYYAALYYAMSVGHAEVQAGGTHEGLIGVGYSVGPLTGLLGLTIASQAQGAGYKLWDGAAVVAVVWLLIFVAAIGVVRPYVQARRARRMQPVVQSTSP